MDLVRWRRPIRFVMVLFSVVLYRALPPPYHYAAALPLLASVLAVIANAMDTGEQR
jgi:hypothetical protein